MVHKSSFIGTAGALWGLAGVLAVLSSAAFRLAPLAVEAFSYPFTRIHWISLAAVVGGMAYAEGYRGFQKAFAPRVAARALYLRDHPRLLHALLAPLFCMGYFHATRRRKITSISLTVGIVILVLLVRHVSQPWRGIIDAGVVVGLGWGLVSLMIFSIMAFGTRPFTYSPEVPEKNR